MIRAAARPRGGDLKQASREAHVQVDRRRYRGSDTATEAVRQAVELARALDAKLELVSAYEPVPRPG